MHTAPKRNETHTAMDPPKESDKGPGPIWSAGTKESGQKTVSAGVRPHTPHSPKIPLQAVWYTEPDTRIRTFIPQTGWAVRRTGRRSASAPISRASARPQAPAAPGVPGRWPSGESRDRSRQALPTQRPTVRHLMTHQMESSPSPSLCAGCVTERSSRADAAQAAAAVGRRRGAGDNRYRTACPRTGRSSNTLCSPRPYCPPHPCRACTHARAACPRPPFMPYHKPTPLTSQPASPRAHLRGHQPQRTHGAGHHHGARHPGGLLAAQQDAVHH